MGFCMTCTNTGKNCSYTTWFSQRVELIKIVVKYLENRITEIQKEIQEKCGSEDECLDGFTIDEYREFIETINSKFIKPIKTTRSNDIIFKVAENPQNYYMKDAMSSFGVYGIHLLCMQSDCGGVYTVGDAMEILQLLKLIKPYFDTSSEIYKAVYTLDSVFSSPIYDIFNDSVTSLRPIRIT